MTRILTAVLLCAASSVGCSSMHLAAQDERPLHLAVSQSAPRPVIQRAGYHTPVNLACHCAEGQGCNTLVNDCVDTVLDCQNCGCGNSYCGSEGCCGSCGDCAYGDCGNPCESGRSGLMDCCTCNGTGQCRCCQRLRSLLGCGSGRHAPSFTPGPPMAQTAYPYYTVKGPRDYFLNKPPSIGPY